VCSWAYPQVSQAFACVLDEIKGKVVLGVDVPTPAGLYSQCPCCFTAGRKVVLAGVAFENKPLDTVEIDFCMKLTHLFRKFWRLVQGDWAKPRNTAKIVPNPVVSNFLVDNAATPQVQSAGSASEEGKECNDFAAAMELGAASTKNDITGLGAALCRHGYMAVVMNCFKGEQYAYAILMLSLVLGLDVELCPQPGTTPSAAGSAAVPATTAQVRVWHPKLRMGNSWFGEYKTVSDGFTVARRPAFDVLYGGGCAGVGGF
jgi:hypothetical protein